MGRLISLHVPQETGSIKLLLLRPAEKVTSWVFVSASATDMLQFKREQWALPYFSRGTTLYQVEKDITVHDITKRQLDCQPVTMLEWSFISQIQFSLWESFQLIMVGIHPALWFAKNVTLRRPGELGVVLNYQKAAGSVAGMQLVFDVFAHVGWKLGAHLGAWANSVFEQKLWNKLGSKNATTATIKQTLGICMFSMSLEVLWRTIVQVFSWRLWGAWFHVTVDCRYLKIGEQVTGSGCSNKL